MVEEPRQGFLGAPRSWGNAEIHVMAVGGLRGFDDAPANSGSAVRHTDVRGSMYTHVGYPQEVAPYLKRFGVAAA